MAERGNQQALGVRCRANALRPGTHEMIQLLGGKITFLGRVDVIGVLHQTVIRETRVVLVIVIVGIPEQRGARALIERR